MKYTLLSASIAIHDMGNGALLRIPFTYISSMSDELI